MSNRFRKIVQLTTEEPINWRTNVAGRKSGVVALLRRGILIIGCSLFMLCGESVAQTAQPDVQFPQNAIDSRMRRGAHVDPASLALGFQIDLGTYRGRAGTSLPITLHYTSKVWRVKHLDVTPIPPCTQKWTACEQDSLYDALYAERSASGWTSSLDWFLWGPPEPLQLYTSLGKPCGDTQPCPDTVARVFVVMPDGSRHEMRRQEAAVSADGFNPNGTYYSVDGAQMKYDYATRTLLLPDGSRYIFSSPQQYIDRNGNNLSYDSVNKRWTDTLGRFIPTPPLTNSTAGDFTYTLAGVNGSSLTYTFSWRYLNDVRTNAQESLRYKGDKTLAMPHGAVSPSLFHSWDEFNNIGVPANLPLFNPVVLYKIELPNQTAYTFTYNVYGEIDKVVYPTGAYEKFTYGEVPEISGYVSSTLGNQYSQANRGVSSRVVSFSGLASDELPPWSYASTLTGSNPVTVTRVITAPDGSRTETVYHNSKGQQVLFGFDDARVGHAYEERIYSASGQLVRRKLTDWTFDSNSTVTRNARVAREVEILLDSSSGALARSITYDYDQYLNVTTFREYAFVTLTLTQGQTWTIGQISLGSDLRTQYTTYVTTQSYLDRNMVSLPATKRTWDAGEIGVVEKTDFLICLSDSHDLTSARRWLFA